MGEAALISEGLSYISERVNEKVKIKINSFIQMEDLDYKLAIMFCFCGNTEGLKALTVVVL